MHFENALQTFCEYISLLISYLTRTLRFLLNHLEYSVFWFWHCSPMMPNLGVLTAKYKDLCDVWYLKYGGLLKCIQKKYDHSPNTTVCLTHNEIIVITVSW